VLIGPVNGGGTFNGYTGQVLATDASASSLFPGVSQIPASGVVVTNVNGIQFATIPSPSAFGSQLATVLFQYSTPPAPRSTVDFTTVTPDLAGDLANLGIYVKSNSQTRAEFQGQPYNAIVMDDWPAIPQSTPEDVKISARRLNAATVARIDAEAHGIWPNFPDRQNVIQSLATGIAAYRADVRPADGNVPASDFARYAMSHQNSADSKELAETLLAMRGLVNDIASLGLAGREALGTKLAWSASTPDDSKLVNDYGETDPTWLYDVLQSLPLR